VGFKKIEDTEAFRAVSNNRDVHFYLPLGVTASANQHGNEISLSPKNSCSQGLSQSLT